MARIAALFAVFALATAASPFSNFTAQYVCNNTKAAYADSDVLMKGQQKHHLGILNHTGLSIDSDKHYLAGGDWNLTTCDSACKDAMVQANHTGLGCCNFNDETNGCGWSEAATPVRPNPTSLTVDNSNTCSGTGVAITTAAECASAANLRFGVAGLNNLNGAPSTIINGILSGVASTSSYQETVTIPTWPSGCICRYPDLVCYFNTAGNAKHANLGVLCNEPIDAVGHNNQFFAKTIDADKWQAKKAHDHYVKKDYAAADIAYQAAVASFVSTFGENHLLTKGVKQRHSIVKVLNNKPARTDLDANYPYTSNTIQLDRCSDGEQNGDETGVDCGGPACTVCPVDCVYSETTCTCTPACDKTCDCTDSITITTPAAGRGQACPSVTNRTFTGAACAPCVGWPGEEGERACAQVAALAGQRNEPHLQCCNACPDAYHGSGLRITQDCELNKWYCNLIGCSCSTINDRSSTKCACDISC